MNEIWAFDPYEILGVRRGASDRTIAAAHRALARQFHPDIAGDAATVRMMRINAAFDAIRTADRRAEYDDLASAWANGTDHASKPRGERPERTSDGSVAGQGRFDRAPERDGTGGAGAPPGRPSGSVLDFGRHIGWSIGEVARVDPGYLEWLANRPEGQLYLAEIHATLVRIGHRAEPATSAPRAFNTGRLGFRRG